MARCTRQNKRMLQAVPDMLDMAGVQIPFDAEIITPPIAKAIRDGVFEAEEAAQIPLIVRRDDTILDIGAGIGFISTLLARQACDGRVISVEANPGLLPFMTRLHALNGVDNIERLNVVLTNSDVPSMTFYLRKDFWMGSLADAPNPFETTLEVPTCALDALLRNEGVNLIVCDIEGAESFLFNGADLSPVDRVYLELHDHVTGLKGVSAVFDDLAAQGFTYDPRHSSGAIVLFRRVEENEVLRPYARD